MADNGINIVIPFGEENDLRFGIKAEPYTFENAERFITRLVGEIKSQARRHRNMTFTTIFVGGCGPSLLTLEQLYRILQALYDSFTINPLEQTMLILPGTIHEEKAKVLRESGFDQLTIRVTKSAIPRRDFQTLRNAGFSSVGFEYQVPPGENISESMINALTDPLPDHIYLLSPDPLPIRKPSPPYYEFIPGHFSLPGKENRHLLNLHHRGFFLTLGTER